MTEDEMVGWHHRLNGRESEQALGDGEGQGSLACYSPRGRKESDTTERLNRKQQGGCRGCGTLKETSTASRRDVESAAERPEGGET